MNKIKLILSVLILSTFFACKDKTSNGQYKLVVISGDLQSGEPNSTLSKDVVVQLLKGDEVIKYKSIKFETSAGQLVTQNTNNEGKATFSWYLNCSLGTQTATISALEPGQVLASVNVSATSALEPGQTLKPCGLPANAMYYRFIFASSTGKLFTGNTSLYASDDGGFNWYDVSGPSSVLKMYQFGNTIYAVGSAGIFRSSNEGISWTQASPITTAAFTQAGNMWYVAQPNGDIYVSNDQGSNWYIAKGNSTATGINQLLVNSNNHVIGISPDAIYRFEQDSIILSREVSQLTAGITVQDKAYIGTQGGTIYQATDTNFNSSMGIFWNTISITPSINVKNLKHINSLFYLSSDNRIFQKDVSSPFYLNSNYTGHILDFHINQNGSIVISHDGQGLNIKP